MLKAERSSQPPALPPTQTHPVNEGGSGENAPSSSSAPPQGDNERESSVDDVFDEGGNCCQRRRRKKREEESNTEMKRCVSTGQDEDLDESVFTGE